MKIRFASVLLALALPLCAQEPTAAETEAMFYKAFYLEKGQRDFAGAMDLYTKFLAKAPEHKLAAEAAKQQFQLLDRTGKTKERDEFKAKYEKLLGNIANAPAAGAGDAAGRGAGGAGPEGGRGERPAAGARPDMAARLAELEKALEKAKADGNAEEQKRIEQQIERAKAGGRGGPGGAGAGRGGAMGALMGQKKIADMSDDEIKQLKEGLGTASTMVERMRERSPEAADKVEAGVANLKKALDANNKEEAQKALDAIREAMPRRGRGGEGGAGAGGGRGGNSGGGGGTGNAGGGGGGGGGTSNGGGGGGGR